MTPLHSHNLARPDATIRYWAGGTEDARTILLLHGPAGSRWPAMA
jgi:hypothetical protein